MKALLVALAALACVFAGSARAGLTEAELAGVTLTPPPDAQAPLDLPLREEAGRAITLGEAMSGRPTVLLLADYTCRSLCGAATTIVAAALENLSLRPGRDYAALVIGLDPRDGPAEAATAKAAALAAYPDLAPTLPFLSGDAASVRALTEAIGYRYALDPEHDQVAHPAGLLVLTGEGRVGRVLSSLALEPGDLRLALVEAGEGRIGGVADRFRLLCYGYDPVHGVYTPVIRRALETGAGLTIVALGGFLWALRRRGAGR